MKRIVAVLVVAALSVVGCSSEETTNPTDAGTVEQADTGVLPDQDASTPPGLDAGVNMPPDAATIPPDASQPQDLPPTVSVTTPTEYAGLKGAQEFAITATDDVGVSKVELFLGASTTPVASKTAQDTSGWNLSWDSTSAADGVATYFVRVTDTVGQHTDTAQLHLIVYNNGQEASYMDGHTNTVVVPSNYDPTSGVELDRKNHWNNPTGIQTVRAMVEWQPIPGKVAWRFGFAVGQGECPHMGQILGNEVVGDTSPLYVEVTMPSDLATGMHFFHVKPMNPMDHLGDSIPYTVHVYLFP